MGSLGKILGPVVVVLAITAAVLSFILSNQRTHFRDRAAILAGGLANTAQNLDTGSASGVAGQISFTPSSKSSPKEGGSLGWEAYKSSEKNQSGAYKKSVDSIVGLADQIVKQRNQLSANMLETASILGYPAELLPSNNDLQNLAKYNDTATTLLAHANSVAERDLAILKNVNEIAALMQSSVPESVLRRPVKTDADGNSQAADYEVTAAFDPFKTAAQDFKERNDLMVKGIAGAVQTVNKHTWKVRPANLARNNTKLMLEEMGRLATDLKTLNEELIRKEALEAEYSKQKEAIAALEDSNRNLEEAKAQLSAKLDNMERQLSSFIGIAGDEEEGEAISSMDEVATEKNGSILLVNREYDFAVIDLTERDVMPGVILAAMRKGEYLATLKVIKATPYQAIVDIYSGNISALKEGDGVIVSAMHMKKLDSADARASKEKKRTAVRAPATEED
ncbi:MAG: hypothetical protein GX946_04845 [Oligosphaeraceae bacterium]|nr:hypothetical protein [Oligosphaeraceae bacterium]